MLSSTGLDQPATYMYTYPLPEELRDKIKEELRKLYAYKYTTDKEMDEFLKDHVSIRNVTVEIRLWL